MAIIIKKNRSKNLKVRFLHGRNWHSKSVEQNYKIIEINI